LSIASTHRRSARRKTAVTVSALIACLSLIACSPEQTPEESAADEPQQTSDVDTFTMAEVEDNDSTDSCWAVMDGVVYDLTAWIDEHPGGGARIEQLCGTDASAAFDAQHGGQENPEEQLSEFEIGVLSD
jgi:cytochrome b involved in lipid metabolism